MPGKCRPSLMAKTLGNVMTAFKKLAHILKNQNAIT